MAKLTINNQENIETIDFSTLKPGEMMEINDPFEPVCNGEIAIKLWNGNIVSLNDLKSFVDSNLQGRKLSKGESVTLTQD